MIQIKTDQEGLVGVRVDVTLFMVSSVALISTYDAADVDAKTDFAGDLSVQWKYDRLRTVKGVESGYPLVLSACRSVIKKNSVKSFLIIIDVQEASGRIVEVISCNETGVASVSSTNDNPEPDEIERIFDSLCDDDTTPIFYAGNHRATYLGGLEKEFKILAEEPKELERLLLGGVNPKTAMRLSLVSARTLTLVGTVVGGGLWIYAIFRSGGILTTLSQYGPNLMDASARPIKDELISKKNQLDRIQGKFQQSDASNVKVNSFAGLVKISLKDGASLSSAQISSDGKFGGNLMGDPKSVLRTVDTLKEFGKLGEISFNVNPKGVATTPFTLEATP
jgi:hypothetical protein